ncbi:MAG: fimbrillin family protein [Tannerellaceae bacterium]
MKKMLIIPLIGTLLMSACAENNSEDIVDSKKITIDAFVPKMQKGTDASTTTLASGISIYAYKTGAAYTSTPFMNDVDFKKDGNVWLSSPTYYWPEYGLDFFGYYPTTVTPTSVSDPSKFSYTVASDTKDEYDVVTAYAANQTKGIVQMQFHHALSKINFVITSYKNSGLNISINSIAIKNIPMSADFVLNTTATEVPNYFTVSNQGPATGTATLTNSPALTVEASTDNVSSNLVSGMYLIPQTLVNWAYSATNAYPLKGTYINLNGSLTGVTDYTGNIAIPITTVKWEPGYSYTYNIVFGNESGSTGGGGYNPDNSTDGGSKPEQILRPIQVNVAVDPWTDITPTIPPVDL